MNFWDDPYSIVEFLRGLNADGLISSINEGFDLFKEYEVKTKHDNCLIIKSFPLHIAAMFNLVSCVLVLIENGVDINQRDSNL